MDLEELVSKSYYISKVCSIDRVVDPDTIHCIIDVGFNIQYNPPKGIRLYGVDGPELHSKNSIEVRAAELVTKEIQKILTTYHANGKLWILSRGLDIYGRILGQLVYLSSNKSSKLLNVNDSIATSGIVRGYDGKKARAPWTDEELNKIIKSLS
jgi:endonuclease YncB( thermonuclease family)